MGIPAPCPAGIAGAPVRQAGDMPGAPSDRGTDGTEPPRPSRRPEQTFADAAEEAAVTRCIAGRLAFEFPDAGVGALERFVLHQHGLHQRIGSVGGLPQAVPDQAFGVRIALGVFQRGQAVEQLDDEIAFLWGHWPSPWSRDDGDSCRQRPWQRNDPRQQKHSGSLSCARSAG
jgi:hypothetical protein